MENENQKEARYLNELIENHYPELRDIKIELNSPGWFLNTSEGVSLSPLVSGIVMGVFSDKNKYIIFYDRSDILGAKRREEDIKNTYEGFFAHELSHIVQKEKKGFKKVLTSLTNFRKEIRIDKDVIKRGLGKELLAVKKFIKEKTIGISKGYNPEKLEQICLNYDSIKNEK